MNFLRRPLRADTRFAQIDTLANTRGNTGGLLKRIDENRELLELLQQAAPDLLADKPWIEGWIRGNDNFFSELRSILQTPARLPAPEQPYPRPWPMRPTAWRAPIAWINYTMALAAARSAQRVSLTREPLVAGHHPVDA